MAFTNGSPRATIETDEERTYFLIDIPCHPYFAKKEIEIYTSGVKGGIKFRTLQRHVFQLQAMRVVVRKDGYWKVVK